MDVLDIDGSGGAIDYAPIQVKESCKDCSLNYYPCGGEKRIKELKGTILDLQSELARKKMSLTVACNRVEELEDKLKVAVDTLKNVKRYLPMWGIDTVMDTLEKLGVGK